MDDPEGRARALEYGLLLFEPVRLIRQVRDVRDIYAQRHLLKQVLPSAATIGHLVRLVDDALAAGVRFRVFESLKVLRVLVVARGPHRLPPATVRRLFGIYRRLILDSREEVQWCLSRLIKDQALENDAVSWLVENWSQSTHVVNRLLRYPVQHRRIAEWAEERYRAGHLAQRRSEIVAILLPTLGLQPFVDEKPEVLGWAALYCVAPKSARIHWIRELQHTMPVTALMQYAVRLNAPIILRTAVRELRSPGPQRETPNKALHPTPPGAIIGRRG